MMLIAALGACKVHAQKVYDGNTDTVKGAETIYIEIVSGSNTNKTVTLNLLCTELGGTADGTITLEASGDGTNFVPITDVSEFLVSFPNDTLTITDGAVMQNVVLENRFYDYRYKVAGTSGDTTIVSTSYLPKSK